MPQRLQQEEQNPQYKSTPPTTVGKTESPTTQETKSTTKTTSKSRKRTPKRRTIVRRQTKNNTRTASEIKSLFIWLLPPIVFLIVLFFAMFVPPVKEFLRRQGEAGKPLWTYIAAQAALGAFGLIGGVVALWQFDRTHQQREEQFQKKARQDERLAERRHKQEKRLAYVRHRQDRLLAEARQEQERLHFARKEQQDQYVDIQNRLKESDPAIRASAALRLAEFAERLLPRTAEERTANPEPARNEKNNPYFLPVASQLTTALYLEENTATRKAIVDALANMTAFAREGDGQPLLHALIERLANVNRAARNGFIRSLAEWSVSLTSETDPNKKNIELAATVARFCDQLQDTVTCIKNLMIYGEERSWGKVTKLGEYAVQRQVALARRKVLEGKERVAQDAQRLPRLEIAAAQLIATRDALSIALKALVTPDSFVEIRQKLHTAQQTGFIELRREAVSSIRSRKRELPRDLSVCFLAGADLRSAHLAGADLRSAHLAGADLYSAHLEDANLRDAYLEDAYLGVAHLAGANLSSAHLAGADLTYAVFDNETILYGIWIQEQDESSAGGRRSTRFHDSNWYDASFRSPDQQRSSQANDARNNQVQEWLAATYPRPPESDTETELADQTSSNP